MKKPKKDQSQPERSTEEARFLRKLGRNLAAERVRRDITQKELAERAGVSSAYVALIEVGRRNPHALLLRKLAKALRIRVVVLFDIEDE